MSATALAADSYTFELTISPIRFSGQSATSTEQTPTMSGFSQQRCSSEDQANRRNASKLFAERSVESGTFI